MCLSWLNRDALRAGLAAMFKGHVLFDNDSCILLMLCYKKVRPFTCVLKQTVKADWHISVVSVQHIAVSYYVSIALCLFDSDRLLT